MILKETIDGKEIKLINLSAHENEYYWDMNDMYATVIFDGNIYTIDAAGFTWALDHIKVKREKLIEYVPMKTSDIMKNLDKIQYDIPDLLKKFIKNGAKESFEYVSDDDFDIHVIVDGKEIGSMMTGRIQE